MSARGRLTRRTALVGSAGALLVASCRSRKECVAYTTVDQVFAEPVFRAFEQQASMRVRAVYDTEETKSTGVLNRLIAEGQNPQADVFWSGDPVRPFQLIKRGLVEPYRSPAAVGLPPGMAAPDGMWTGFAARARVLLVNKLPSGVEPPRSVADLIHPRFKGQTAIASPLFGTTTMHVAALFAVWGTEKTRAFLNDLKANEARIASSNGEVKRLVVSGEVLFGLTDTDDAHEAISGGANVEVVYPDQDGLGTLIMPTSVVLLARAPRAAAGRRLIDYLLSAEVERQMAERAAHMPLRPAVPTPPQVRAAHTLRAMPVDYARVSEQIETQQAWLREWVGI